MADMCNQDGISTPPSDMHYLIHPYGKSQGAPMIYQLIKSGQPKTIYTIGVAYATLGATWGTVALPYLQICPPDIVIGYNFGTSYTAFESDRIRQPMYHETGHALHYRKTSNQFWLDLINYEGITVLNTHGDPYGSPSNTGWGKMALAETWAEHIGTTYTHRRYEQNHSLGTGPILGSWFKELELVQYGFVLQNTVYPPNVPCGLLHDLMDNNTQNTTANSQLTDNGNVINYDNVGGFTNQMLYNELGSGSQDIYDYRDNVKNNELSNTSNTSQAYDYLMSAYGL